MRIPTTDIFSFRSNQSEPVVEPMNVEGLGYPDSTQGNRPEGPKPEGPKPSGPGAVGAL